MHIHVIKGEGFAKVELENQEDFTRIWNEWFS